MSSRPNLSSNEEWPRNPFGVNHWTTCTRLRIAGCSLVDPERISGPPGLTPTASPPSCTSFAVLKNRQCSRAPGSRCQLWIGYLRRRPLSAAASGLPASGSCFASSRLGLFPQFEQPGISKPEESLEVHVPESLRLPVRDFLSTRDPARD